MKDPDAPEVDAFLEELMAAMLRPIGSTCRVCRCPDDDHSRILVGRPCLNFDCVHVCYGFDPYRPGAAAIVPLIVR